MHDAIHAVREQHRRAVTRGLLTQQKALAADNAQIRRNSIPDQLAMSLPDEQELDRKRPMVSPVAVQRCQTVSHKQPARQGLML